MRKISSGHGLFQRTLFPRIQRFKSIVPVENPQPTISKHHGPVVIDFIEPEIETFYDPVSDPNSVLQYEEIRKVGFLKALLSEKGTSQRN